MIKRAWSLSTTSRWAQGRVSTAQACDVRPSEIACEMSACGFGRHTYIHLSSVYVCVSVLGRPQHGTRFTETAI